MKNLLRYLKFLPLEALIWISGLLLLVLVFSESGISVCPLHNLGISFCPGCGLGQSIIYLTRFDLQNSFSSNPLGIPALLIILHRIIILFKQSLYLAERNTK